MAVTSDRPTQAGAKIDGTFKALLNDNTNQMTGRVGRAGPDITSCRVEGQVPCKVIAVKNPGGRAQDRLRSFPLYNLKAGPAPIPQSRFPDFGPSIGTTGVLIRGINLDFVESVTFGGTAALLQINGQQSIGAISPPHVAGNTPVQILLNDIDFGSTVVPGGFLYRPTRPTKVSPILPFDDVYIVGPGGEAVMPAAGAPITPSNTCITDIQIRIRQLQLPHERLPGISPVVQAFTVSRGDSNIKGCPREFLQGTITFTLGNSAAPMDRSLWVPASLPFAIDNR